MARWAWADARYHTDAALALVSDMTDSPVSGHFCGGKTTAMARDRYRGLAVGAAALIAGVTTGVTPAYAQSDEAWVESHPNPAEPGGQVIVIGSCGDVDVDAMFESLAFAGSRKVPADIDHHTGQVSAHVRIPQGLRANDYNINLFCEGSEHASTTLTVKDGGHRKPKRERHHPTKGPRTGGGGTANAADASHSVDQGRDDHRVSLMVAGGLAVAGGRAVVLARRRRHD